MEMILNRAQRRAEEKAAKSKKKQPNQFMQSVAGACAFFSQIAMCRPYDSGAIIGDTSGMHETAERAKTRSIVNVRSALQRLIEGVSAEIDDPILISEALGVASVRAVDIGGKDAKKNPLLASLQDGQRVMQSVKTRHERFNKLQLTPAETDRLAYAVGMYVDVMDNSTPQQMEDAMKTRIRIRQMAQAGKLAG